MAKRKTLIELQSKPENKSVRQLFDKPKTVDYAPLTTAPVAGRGADNAASQEIEDDAEINLGIENGGDNIASPVNELQAATEANENLPKGEVSKKDATSAQPKSSPSSDKSRSDKAKNTRQKPASFAQAAPSQAERMRIFQTSTPVTRTVTKFQKAAIVVRGENGKEMVELYWRDQMNDKTKDIWNYLVGKFQEAENQNLNEISIRKREILDGSNVKSDRTFISAIYTLEDMGLIEVKRLSGNKEGNIYVLTEEGREEIDGYGK